MPIERLLFTPQSEMTDDENDIFYAQSWVLTHYLQSSVERNREMLRYFDMLAKDTDPREAAIAAFGDLEELDKTIRKYGRRSIDYRKSDTLIAIVGDIEITDLSEIDSDLVENELYLRVEFEPDRVLKRLRSLAGTNTENAKVHALLAWAETDQAHREGHFAFEAALAARDRTIELDARLLEAHVQKANLLMEPADHEEIDGGAVNWVLVRDHIGQANAIDPDDPRPLLAFVNSFEKEGGEMPPIALRAMMQVFGTMPEVRMVRTRLARLLAAAGRFGEALALVRFLAADPHAGTSGKPLIKEVRELQSKAGDETAEREKAYPGTAKDPLSNPAQS